MAAGLSGFDRNNAILAAGLVGFALNLDPVRILATDRSPRPVAKARQVAMYLSYAGFGMSLARVAAAFRRDRSTVAHGCRLVEDRRDDPAFDAWMLTLEEGLQVLLEIGPDAKPNQPGVV
ncbi:MAG: helix-turn-helix domain-containing protein [Pseudomonadota bacterium]